MLIVNEKGDDEFGGDQGEVCGRVWREGKLYNYIKISKIEMILKRKEKYLSHSHSDC